MKKIIHKANTRGFADHGWLKSYHSFSFAGYHNPERMNFGVLRVFNDDRVEGGKGFGLHPHANMEIISIPLKGDLEHKDSLGNTGVIQEGDIQVMSAGTGIYHSEYNKNPDKPVEFFQIWILPNQEGVEPRYDQLSFNSVAKKNEFYQIASPDTDDQGIWIHQNAWLHLGEFESEKRQHYTLKQSGNGLYAFIIEGSAIIEGETVGKRDAIGIWDTDTVKITAQENTKILLLDVPMMNTSS